MGSSKNDISSDQSDADESLLPPKIFANSSYRESDEVKVYKTRWYILVLFCGVSILQSTMWNTWGPIQATARAVFAWEDYMIDLLAAWGSTAFCVSVVPALGLWI